MMMEELYNSFYSDWMVEMEREDTSVLRMVDILEGLTRHGPQMTET